MHVLSQVLLGAHLNAGDAESVDDALNLAQRRASRRGERKHAADVILSTALAQVARDVCVDRLLGCGVVALVKDGADDATRVEQPILEIILEDVRRAEDEPPLGGRPRRRKRRPPRLSPRP